MLEIESNDTISLANIIEFEDGASEVITGDIADDNDVDIFGIELQAGETLFADIDAGINDSTLNSVLTIFDVDGNLLVQNDDNIFELDGETIIEDDAFQQFTAIADGIYYVGVSSSANLDYDPNLAGSGTGDSSGSYGLNLRIEEFAANELAAEPNDFSRVANIIELDPSEPLVIAGEIGDNSIVFEPENDVDLFEIELEGGEIINADINAEIIGSALDPVLSIFDINGELLAQNDDNSFEIEGEVFTEIDSFQQFIAPEDGTYYIGVSSFGNLEYDPTLINSGAETGESTGFYNLVLSFAEEIPDDDGEEREIPDDEIDDEDDSRGGTGDRITDNETRSTSILDDGVTSSIDNLITTDSEILI